MKITASNFRHNFHSATGAKDGKLTADLLFNELTDIVVNHPEKVQLALSKAGIKSGTGQKELIDKISENMSSNAKLSGNLAKLIVEKDLYHNQDGKKKIDYAKVANDVKNIGGMLSGLFGKKGKTQSSSSTYQADRAAVAEAAAARQAAARAELAARVAARKSKPNYGKIAMWTIGIGLVFGGVIFAVKKLGK